MRGAEHQRPRVVGEIERRKQMRGVGRFRRAWRHENRQPINQPARELFKLAQQQAMMRGRFKAAEPTPGGEIRADRAAKQHILTVASKRNGLRFEFGAVQTNEIKQRAQLTVPLPVPTKKSACPPSISAAASVSSRASNAVISSGLKSLSFLRSAKASIICTGRP